MEKEYLDFNLNEKTFFDKLIKSKLLFHIVILLKIKLINWIKQIKISGKKQKVILCREYRDFFAKIIDYNINKYIFLLINVTAYNAVRFIKNTLNSIINQTLFKNHNNYEIILEINEVMKYLNISIL